MQGSFSSESANKFLQLMSEAGYSVENNLNGSDRETFSGGVSRTVNPWEGNVAEFGETRGEYIDNYDFARCVRPDGSSYGTAGKCRKGTESAKESKPRATEKSANSLLKKHGELSRKIESETKRLSGMLKGKKYEGMRSAVEEKIKKLKASRKKIADIRERVNKQLDEEARRSGAARQLMPDDWNPGFSEEEKYDFARCVRPDGSSYGTAGKCRKGTQADKQHAAKKELTPDEEWMQGRLKTLKTLKGKSKRELLSILNQNRKIHGLTEKDSVRDLKGAILSSIHGNDSPSDIKQKRAAQMARIQRQREAQRQRQEEQSAIDQLSQMLPKGEKIMDSLGDISIATGGAK